MNPMGMRVEADRLDCGKIVDETACCGQTQNRTLYDLLVEAVAVQQAAQERLSGVFCLLGLEPHKREQGCGCCDNVYDMARMLTHEMHVLNQMTISLSDMIGAPKIN